MVSFESCFYYAIWYFIAFLTIVVTANEEPISVNKPVVKSWQFSSDNVRCFCNLPACVLTGYMCKSNSGGCFSEVLDKITNERGRHGCLELLEEKYRCRGKTGISERTIRRKDNSKIHLMCCHHDMCNYIENSQAKDLINMTLLDESLEDIDTKYQQRRQTFLYSDSEVWFRAATIAVPICGAVILFVLIALAVKILKSEQENVSINKLGPTLYIQPISQQKHSNEKSSEDNFHRTYDNLLRKDYVTSPHNHFYCNHTEEYQRQVSEPLIQRECNGTEEKNATHARYNLVNYEDSGKSIILEIEKERLPRSQVNCNYAGDINKFSGDKTFSP